MFHLIFHLGFPDRLFKFQSLDLKFQGLDLPNEYRLGDATATRASQIAAALLFELGTVDIRRAGTT